MLLNTSSTLDGKGAVAVGLFVLLFFGLFSIKNVLLSWTRSAAEDALAPAHPNILMIVVDDLGYNDTSAINSGGLPTPNIKQLAQEGMTFRRHYADSTCTPSRVAMLTGRYAERSGFRPVGTQIPAEYPTIAQQLQEVGYTSYLTGKWHAGEEGPLAQPEHKGFDEWFGFLNQFELSGEVAAANTSEMRPTYRNPMLRVNGGQQKRYDGHLTDILTDHTIKKLQALQGKGESWFLYHAFLAPHHPIQPAERYAKRFADTPEGKYIALVTQLDDAVGRILEVVDREKTLVIFVSDNGGTNVQRDNNFPFFGRKNQPLEGAYRTPLIFAWPGVVPQGRFSNDVVMNVDIYPTILAAVHAAPPPGLDGLSLWGLLLKDIPIKQRSRGWEAYHPNINSVSYSFLAAPGDWRLSSRQGATSDLFHLAENSAGQDNVASQYKEHVTELRSQFWLDHWEKSLLPVNEYAGIGEEQRRYTGFDVMRAPYRHGFSIGVEVGPIPVDRLQGTGEPHHVLAGQEGIWELHYRPGHGLEWHIGDVVLSDASFEPSRCNSIVLTGYFQPHGPLTKREPRSPLKLYSSGLLRDIYHDFSFGQIDDALLGNPTFVNFNGAARFSNMMLSSYSDSYEPRLEPEHYAAFTALFQQKRLSIAEVKMMDDQLCN